MNKYLKKIIGVNNVLKMKSEIYFRRNKMAKDLLKRNNEFKNSYKGKRCFIIGNGPSIHEVDFTTLQNEIVFTVNQLPRNPDFKKLHTNFHVWSDERFFSIDKNKREDIELLKVMKSVNTDDNKPVIFYKLAARQMIQEFDLEEVLDIRYYDEIGIEMDLLKKADLDFTKPVAGFPTVIHYAICLAVYMGFTEIVLLGCDCTGFISTANARMSKAEEALYGYEISKNEKRRLEKLQKKTSIRDELYWQVVMFDVYEILNQYCEYHGCKLYNATKPTLIEGVECIDLNRYLEK
jgi:hypothetical protein